MTEQPTAWVTVDLEAIADNVRRVREVVGDAQVMAVVKGDAYGHGLLPAARTALGAGATWLGVAQLSEALALRSAGIDVPVLSWLHAPGTDFAAAVAAGVDLGVPSLWELRDVVAAAAAVGRPARIHLKIDTGMARNGAYGADWAPLRDAAARAQADGSVEVVGLFTHLACADIPGHPSVPLQQEVFMERAADAERVGLNIQVRHMANSAATLMLPQTHLDLVRPGLACYGLSPVPEQADPAALGLRPAMRVEAKAALVKRVPAGQGVSYGHTYTTDRETTLVDVPIGYVDGVTRAGSGKAPVQVAGRRHSITGRVCMDQFVVDVGDQQVTAGDPVVLFGNGSEGEPTAEDWAEVTDTISYEIVSRMSSRLPRRYVGGGQG